MAGKNKTKKEKTLTKKESKKADDIKPAWMKLASKCLLIAGHAIIIGICLLIAGAANAFLFMFAGEMFPLLLFNLGLLSLGVCVLSFLVSIICFIWGFFQKQSLASNWDYIKPYCVFFVVAVVIAIIIMFCAKSGM